MDNPANISFSEKENLEEITTSKAFANLTNVEKVVYFLCMVQEKTVESHNTLNYAMGKMGVTYEHGMFTFTGAKPEDYGMKQPQVITKMHSLEKKGFIEIVAQAKAKPNIYRFSDKWRT